MNQGQYSIRKCNEQIIVIFDNSQNVAIVKNRFGHSKIVNSNFNEIYCKSDPENKKIIDKVYLTKDCTITPVKLGYEPCTIYSKLLEYYVKEHVEMEMFFTKSTSYMYNKGYITIYSHNQDIGFSFPGTYTTFKIIIQKNQLVLDTFKSTFTIANFLEVKVTIF